MHANRYGIITHSGRGLDLHHYMLTLEQLFPTKLVERDPDRVNSYVEQLPEGRVMMIEAGNIHLMVCKHDQALNRLDVVIVSSDNSSTIENRLGWTIKPVNVSDNWVWRVASNYHGPYDVGIMLHPYPGAGNRSISWTNFDLGYATPYAIEWYPNYGNVEEYWPRHKEQLRLCIEQIYAMSTLHPCKRALKGEILDKQSELWIAEFNKTFHSVYGKSGYRLRKLTIASQNALARFLIWMKRYTSSIWHTVPVEICRLIAAYCRPYA